MPLQKHLLVIRFSALGDVAMTVPVIKNLLDQHPEVHITFVSTPFVKPLFSGQSRLDFVPVFLQDQHKGVWGMIKLFNQLRRKQKYDYVVDLHDVLRTKVLRFLWMLSGARTVHIDKGRKEKRQLTRKKNKILRQLKTSFQRYADTFERAGIPVKLDSHNPVLAKREIPESLRLKLIPGKKTIGIAPYSKHKEKMYPLDRMKNLLIRLNVEENVQLLFLGSKAEAPLLEEWASEMEESVNVAGKFSFEEELGIISNLSLVVSMDSANVHLASLFGVPVITIWGATHPFAGFQGWGQPDSNNVQIELSCRPCSVYGQKGCFRGDHACVVWMPEDMILEKIKALI